MSDEMPSIIEYSDDISSAEAPVPLPKGDYIGTIRSAELKQSQKGNNYVSVAFFIPADQYPATYTDGNPDGETLTYNRVPADDSARGRYRMRKFCEAIGAVASKKIDLGEWIGLTAKLTVGEDEYEGEKRAQITKVSRA